MAARTTRVPCSSSHRTAPGKPHSMPSRGEAMGGSGRPAIEDKEGDLYGTTAVGGGDGCDGSGCGTVFKITPDGNEAALYAFTGGSDGRYPYAGLIADRSGTSTARQAAGADMDVAWAVEPSSKSLRAGSKQSSMPSREIKAVFFPSAALSPTRAVSSGRPETARGKTVAEPSLGWTPMAPKRFCNHLSPATALIFMRASSPINRAICTAQRIRAAHTATALSSRSENRAAIGARVR